MNQFLFIFFYAFCWLDLSLIHELSQEELRLQGSHRLHWLKLMMMFLNFLEIGSVKNILKIVDSIYIAVIVIVASIFSLSVLIGKIHCGHVYVGFALNIKAVQIV